VKKGFSKRDQISFLLLIGSISSIVTKSKLINKEHLLSTLLAIFKTRTPFASNQFVIKIDQVNKDVKF